MQTDGYYPFGLTFNSYQRENSVEQRWKFQGQEHIDDLGLNWDSFKWRNQQPDIGRFFNIDPLAEKFYYNSPYAFSENKVTSHIELEGLEAVSPSWLRTAVFAVSHPIAASSIGYVFNGATNMSTNASRFSNRGASKESRESVLGSPRPMRGEGTETNAFRHVLWQASITSEFGVDIATQVGMAHEENPNAINDGLIEGTVFENRGQADESVDLANNIVGRDLGANNEGMGMKDLALMTLEVFRTEGLWTVTPNSDGTFSAQRTQITDEQYQQLQKVFEQLNDNGYTEEEQRKKDETHVPVQL